MTAVGVRTRRLGKSLPAWAMEVEAPEGGGQPRKWAKAMAELGTLGVSTDMGTSATPREGGTRSAENDTHTQ